MSVETRIATSHPSAMWREVRYWKSAWKLAVTFLVGGLVVAAVTLLAYEAADSRTYWALTLHLLTVAGLVVALRALACLEVDEAIATTVEARATSAVGEIKGGARARCELEQIEEDFLPHNPGRQGGTLSVFRNVLQEARDRKFHSSRALIQPLRERYAGDMHVMHSFQRLALQLGILLTFAGLIWALGIFKNAPETQERINGMFDGLYMAFGTSVAGLEVAAIIGVMLLFLRRRQEDFFQRLDSATSILTSLSRNAINPDYFNAELEQVRSSMEDLSARVWDQSREIERHTDEVRSGIERLADLKLRFNEFLSGVQGEQTRVLDEMRSVYDIISPKGVAQDMRQGLLAAVGEVTQRVDQDLSGALRQLEGLEPALARLETLAEKSGEESERRVRDLAAERTGLRNLRGELRESLGEIRQLHEQTLSRAGTPLDQYRSTVIDALDRSLSRTTLTVTDHLDKIHRRMVLIQRQAGLGTASPRRRRVANRLQRAARWLVRLARTEVLPWRRRATGTVSAEKTKDSTAIGARSAITEIPVGFEAVPEEVEAR